MSKAFVTAMVVGLLLGQVWANPVSFGEPPLERWAGSVAMSVTAKV